MSELLDRDRLRRIIALKGLPSTCKTEVADRLGRWAKCPVLCIDDSLGGPGECGDQLSVDDDFSPPTSPDQVERHHRHAFGTLLKVAQHNLNRRVSNCVVIKSRLNTPNDLQQLLELTRIYRFNRRVNYRVVIVECKIRNQYLWRERFNKYRYRDSRRWYKARSWKDVEKARDDYAAVQSQAWDLHLHLLKAKYDGYRRFTRDVRWLVVEPFNDLFFRLVSSEEDPLPDEFTNAIKYLLTADKEELNKQNPYVVEYDQLRRSLFDKELSAAESKPRSEYHCHGDCVFKYWQDYKAEFCGVCGQQVSGPAYTCYFCVATLHKTCAERIHNVKALQTKTVITYFLDYYIRDRFAKQHPCKACTQGGRNFSKECRSCLFQNRLKCDVVPTIINHNFHHHFLSIHLSLKSCGCKACGTNIRNYSFSYGCKRCASHYHLCCAFLPLELKHKHGGYNHTMKLMHSHDGLEQEEDYWCDVCYKDMDPQLWFYSCQECPNYVAHLYCAGGYHQTFDNPKDVKYVEQVQSQLEEATAEEGMPTRSELCSET